MTPTAEVLAAKLKRIAQLTDNVLDYNSPHPISEVDIIARPYLNIEAGPHMNDEQLARFEVLTSMSLLALNTIAYHAAHGLDASSGFLRQQCGLSAEEWHDAGELIASLLCFAAENGFREWHAKTMVGLVEDAKPCEGDPR